MQILKFGEKLNSPIVICLGFFGCMHRGHQKLLQTAKDLALTKGSKVAMFTFSNNHLRVLGKDVKPLYTFKERCDIYQGLGVDFLITAEFTSQFKSMTAKNFLQTLSSYDLAGIVCGFDYTCGSDRQNYQFISEVLPNVAIKVVQPVCEEQTKISTTYVRQLLDNCQVVHANKLLSRPFFVDGKVVAGRGVGKKLGFATANVFVYDDKYLPSGVFCGEAIFDGASHKCIVNIGSKPTYDIDEVSLEAHVLDNSQDLYGKDIRIVLTGYLRPIQKFQNQDQLIQQLNTDKENCLNDQIWS